MGRKNNISGTKKVDIDDVDFCLEIKISKTSLSRPSDLPTATQLCGVLSKATRAFRNVSATATSLRGVGTKVVNINNIIKEFEQKIKNWHKYPIADCYAFMLYILTKLPPKEISRFGSYYVVDEYNGSYRLRIATHNAKSVNFSAKNENYKIGVTFKSADDKNTFESNKDIFYKEHVYYTEHLTSDTLKEILQGIVNVLKGGLYNTPCDLALYSPSKEKYIEQFGECGLDGYTTRDNGTALSENAEEAEREGKFSAGTFRQKYKVAKTDFDILNLLGIIRTREWHHTGKNFKKTDFYEWADHSKRDYTDAQIEDESFADIYQQNKKKIGDLIRRITEHDFAFDKEESKYGVPDEYTCIYYDFKELLKGTPIIDKYYEEQERISNMSDVYMPYERKEMHEEVDKKYRREYQDLLSKKYHEKWDEQIKFNENVDKINEQIKAKNLKKDCAEIYCIKLCKMFGFDDERSYNCAISYRKSVEIEQQKAEERRKLALAKELYEEDKKVFLDWRSKQIKKGNITYLERVSKKPNELFFLEKTEMQGKYGWFEASSRYNLQEYYSGYSCKNKRVYNEYLKRIPHYKDINTLQGLDGIVEIHYLNDKTKIGVISPYNSAFVSKAHDLNGKWGRFEDKNGVSHKCWIFDISEEKEVKDALFKIYGSTGEKGERTVTLLVKNFSDRCWRSAVNFHGIEVAYAFGRNSGAKLGSQIIWIDGRKGSSGSVKNWYTYVEDATFKIKDVPIGLLENEDLKKEIEEGKVEVLEEEPTPAPDNDRERRLRLAKARAKAMIMLQEQRNRETTQN